MTEPRWLNARDHHMWRAFQQMRTSLDRVLERDLMATAGLSAADFSILVPLSESPGRRLRSRDLGLLLSWDRSRLSHQIRRMEQRKLVARSNCPTDARGTFIGLTELGWQTIQEAAPAHVDAVRANFFDVLTDADIDALEDISRRVSARIASRIGEQPVCPGAAETATETAAETADC